MYTNNMSKIYQACWRRICNVYRVIGKERQTRGAPRQAPTITFKKLLYFNQFHIFVMKYMFDLVTSCHQTSLSRN